MSKKVIINPVTRISGFLEIEVIINNNTVNEAKCAGVLYRGFEKMLKGRSPFDAIYFTERICGICSTAHGFVSSKALENAYNLKVPENEQIIKAILHGSEFLQNHIRHFYQLTVPDFIYGFNVEPLYSVNHNDFRIPKEKSDKIIKNYFESIKYSRAAHQISAILGGKAPHSHGIVPGGVSVNITSDKIAQIKSLLKSIYDFVSTNMIEDVGTIAKYYDEYFKNGIGCKRFMSYGVFLDYKKDISYVEPGVLINGEVKNIDFNKISEGVEYSWYRFTNDNGKMEEEADVYKKDAYSFVKTPRYEGLSMEVGPLARLLINGYYKNGISTMDRTIARVLECKYICEIINDLIERLKPIPVNIKDVNKLQETLGSGYSDTTRGALSHHINVKNGVIENYTIITPSTWNLSPKDSQGNNGPVEQALIGTHIENIENPLEIGRIVRSFDPCVSCATHVISNNHSPLKIRVV